jgi:hypothetical protein
MPTTSTNLKEPETNNKIRRFALEMMPIYIYTESGKAIISSVATPISTPTPPPPPPPKQNLCKAWWEGIW